MAGFGCWQVLKTLQECQDVARGTFGPMQTSQSCLQELLQTVCGQCGARHHGRTLRAHTHTRSICGVVNAGMASGPTLPEMQACVLPVLLHSQQCPCTVNEEVHRACSEACLPLLLLLLPPAVASAFVAQKVAQHTALGFECYEGGDTKGSTQDVLHAPPNPAWLVA